MCESEKSCHRDLEKSRLQLSRPLLEPIVFDLKLYDTVSRIGSRRIPNWTRAILYATCIGASEDDISVWATTTTHEI